jgi:hypothetical protein
MIKTLIASRGSPSMVRDPSGEVTMVQPITSAG